ncbi:30767_t:CDS:1, partial [Racocetra persica]
NIEQLSKIQTPEQSYNFIDGLALKSLCYEDCSPCTVNPYILLH